MFGREATELFETPFSLRRLSRQGAAALEASDERRRINLLLPLPDAQRLPPWRCGRHPAFGGREGARWAEAGRVAGGRALDEGACGRQQDASAGPAGKKIGSAGKRPTRHRPARTLVGVRGGIASGGRVHVDHLGPCTLLLGTVVRAGARGCRVPQGRRSVSSRPGLQGERRLWGPVQMSFQGAGRGAEDRHFHSLLSA